MKDISQDLSNIITDKKCSSLLAFIMFKNGIYNEESKSNEQSGRGLRDKRNMPTDGQIMGEHLP